MSDALSVSHLRPRSSLGYVVLVNWLSRALLGWLIALPVIQAIGESGISSLPQADRALFEAGGLWLVELGFRERHALTVGLYGGLWLALTALLVRTPVSALLFSVNQDPAAPLSIALRRALCLFRRFVGFSALELCGRGLALAVAGLLSYGLETLLPHPRNEMLAAWPVALACLVFFLSAATLSVFFDCSRAFSAAKPKLRLREVFVSAATQTRAAAYEWAGSFTLYLGAGALLVVGSGRCVETLDVGRAGAPRVVAVSLLHQAVLLVLCLLQAAWVRRVRSLAQLGPDSASTLR